MLAVAFMAAPAGAAVVVGFGGDMVASDVYLFDLVNVDSVFDDASPTSPDAGYAGPVFYTGAWKGESHFDGVELKDNGGTDHLLLDIWKNSAGVLVLVKDEDFAGSPASVDVDAQMTFTATTGGWIDYVAFVVQDSAGDYYVSPKAAQSGDDWTLTGPGNWMAYDPATHVQPPEGTGAPQSFGDVQALGVYFGFHGNRWQPSGQLDSWQVSVVPEPGTIALLALGGLAMVIRRRH
jgi:hypothetical protein